MRYTTCCKNLHLLVAPSLVEVEDCVCSLYCEVEIVCWLRALSLFGRGGFVVVLPRWHCKVERGVLLLSGLEILLGEGGDVELGA